MTRTWLPQAISAHITAEDKRLAEEQRVVARRLARRRERNAARQPRVLNSSPGLHPARDRTVKRPRSEVLEEIRLQAERFMLKAVSGEVGSHLGFLTRIDAVLAEPGVPLYEGDAFAFAQGLIRAHAGLLQFCCALMGEDHEHNVAAKRRSSDNALRAAELSKKLKFGPSRGERPREDIFAPEELARRREADRAQRLRKACDECLERYEHLLTHSLWSNRWQWKALIVRRQTFMEFCIRAKGAHDGRALRLAALGAAQDVYEKLSNEVEQKYAPSKKYIARSTHGFVSAVEAFARGGTLNAFTSKMYPSFEVSGNDPDMRAKDEA